MLAAIGLFLPPVVGVFIFRKVKKDFSLKDMIMAYMLLILFCNLLDIMYFKFTYDVMTEIGTLLNYDLTYFIRYSCISILLSVLIPILYIICNRHIKIPFVDDKDEKKKKK